MTEDPKLPEQDLGADYEITPGGIFLPSEYWSKGKEGVISPETSFRENYRKFRKAYKFLKELSVLHFNDEKDHKERTGQPWPRYDSGLVGGIDLRGNPVGFNEEFGGLMGELGSIEAYIKANYPKRAIILMELGGSARNLVYDLEKRGVGIEASAGVELADHREPYEVWEDVAINHEVLNTDIFCEPYSDGESDIKFSGMEPIAEWLGKQERDKCDLIIFRIIGPLFNFSLEYLPKGEKEIFEHLNIIFLRSFLKWYDFLSEDGTMLATCPNNVADQIIKFARVIDPEGKYFEIETEEAIFTDKQFVDLAYTRLRLKRLKGSPDKISLKELFVK